MNFPIVVEDLVGIISTDMADMEGIMIMVLGRQTAEIEYVDGDGLI
ncbi:MAG TPA: hypothetical protein VN379_18535 [Sporomusa sp.]|nr:hypothetical protein [Sporomusa sp.]HWR08856.1 hypothetical protein [Sporomusa sp.]